MAAKINVDKALRVSTESKDDVAVTGVLPKRSHPRSSSSHALASCRKIAPRSRRKARVDILGRRRRRQNRMTSSFILTNLRNVTNGTWATEHATGRPDADRAPCSKSHRGRQENVRHQQHHRLWYSHCKRPRCGAWPRTRAVARLGLGSGAH